MLAVALTAEGGTPTPHGAIAESVNPVLPAGRAGLQPGDMLERVGRGDGMDVRDPFDALVAELEHSDNGGTTLGIQRRGRTLQLEIGVDVWGVQWLPAFDAAQLRRYRQELAPLERSDASAYCDGLLRLANESFEPASRAAGWLRWRCAQAAADKRDWPRSDQAFSSALTTLAGDGRASAALYLLRARQAMLAQSWERAEAASRSAAEAARDEHAHSPLALRIAEIGVRIDLFRSRLAAAATGYEALLTHTRSATPGSLLEASLLNGYASALRDLGRREEAEAAFLQALAIRAARAPLGMEVASIHNNFSTLLRDTQSTRALAQSQAAVDMYLKVAPDSPQLATAMQNLGQHYRIRGDLVAAEKWQRAALAIRSKIAPDSYDVAASLGALATIALDRGELERARELDAQAMPLIEKTMAGTLPLATNYQRRGRIELGLGHFDASTRAYEASVALLQQLAPGGLEHAGSVSGIGRAAEARGELIKAKAQYQSALQMIAKVSPGGEVEAGTLLRLAAVDLGLGHPDEAEPSLRRAMAYYDGMGTESIEVALSRQLLAETLRRLGRVDEAREAACAAERSIEGKRSVVNASRELQSTYAARYAEIPRECAAALIDADRAAEAFDVIERSRARALREHLSFSAQIADALLPRALLDRRADLVVRRAKLEAVADAGSDPAPLAALRQDEEVWLRDVGRVSPRYAEAIGGTALSADEVLTRLPAHTAVIVFAVGTERSEVLLLSGADRHVRARTLPIGREALKREVDSLLAGLRADLPRATADRRLAQFYARWFGPFDADLLTVDRLLIVPDGALNLVPFAALRRDWKQYLVEQWTLSVSPSVTVAMRAAPAAGHRSMLAVATTGPRTVVIEGVPTALPALPNAATEVNAIVADAADAVALVDGEASEARVRSHASTATLIHFATHAFVDGVKPLQSGLLLGEAPAAPSREDQDGIAHAWEIMATWHLQAAPLVVLSACDTALGQERDDEGLIGLTRAFQFSGARGVIASLWPVADAPTSALMQALHAGLEAGQEPATALRHAQLQALAVAARPQPTVTRGIGGLSPRTAVASAAPYRWAAFEVFGVMP